MDSLRNAAQYAVEAHREETAVKPSTILSFLDSQSNCLDILGVAVHLLAEKLNPVLIPSISQPQDINKPRPAGEKSAFGELVKSNVVRTEMITDEVRTLIERLDL